MIAGFVCFLTGGSFSLKGLRSKPFLGSLPHMFFMGYPLVSQEENVCKRKMHKTLLKLLLLKERIQENLRPILVQP